MCSSKDTHKNAYSGIIYKGPKLEQPKCPSTVEWMSKPQYIHAENKLLLYAVARLMLVNVTLIHRDMWFLFCEIQEQAKWVSETFSLQWLKNMCINSLIVLTSWGEAEFSILWMWAGFGESLLTHKIQQTWGYVTSETKMWKHCIFLLVLSQIIYSGGSWLPCCEDAQVASKERATWWTEANSHLSVSPWRWSLQPQSSLQMTAALTPWLKPHERERENHLSQSHPAKMFLNSWNFKMKNIVLG